MEQPFSVTNYRQVRDQFATGFWCDGNRKRQLPIGEFESALENRRRLLKTDR